MAGLVSMSTNCTSLFCPLQAAQVRKSSYVPDVGADYDPDSYHTRTVYAGTVVQQVGSCLDQSSTRYFAAAMAMMWLQMSLSLGRCCGQCTACLHFLTGPACCIFRKICGACVVLDVSSVGIAPMPCL
jgi:hypothetical protein